MNSQFSSSQTSQASTISIVVADNADKAVQQLLGHDAPLTRTVKRITQSLREDAQRIQTGQSSNSASIAIVGKVGEGKSWLARAFISENESTTEALSMVKSGQNSSHRSMKLTWLGTQQPLAPLSDGEQFIKLSPHNMLDLGAPYLLADSPGFSDNNPILESLSSVALASSNIKLLATSISNIRDASLHKFIKSMDGSLIIPVIRYRSNDLVKEYKDDIKADLTDENKTGILQEIARWSEFAPNATILPPVYIPDAGIFGESAAKELSRQRLSQAISPLLSDATELTRHSESQLQQRIQLARNQLATALTEFRQRIGTSVDRLDQLNESLPGTIQKEIIGDPAQLRLGVRSRFRADAIDRTPGILFPYRSLMGVLGLTQGAWDRLIFTTLGSVPSLVMTAFHSVKSWSKSKDFETSLREQTHQRLRSLINDAYREDIKNFSYALNAVTEHDNTRTTHDSANIIDIYGLTGIEIESQEIISKIVKKRRISGFTIWLGGITAFLIFWGMLLGPAFALYSDYFSALGKTADSINIHWDNYPKPPASLWLTSVLLSIIPAGLIAMIVMHLTGKNGRVNKATNDIREEISQTIRDRIQSDKLRLVITDENLNAARNLLALSKVTTPETPSNSIN